MTIEILGSPPGRAIGDGGGNKPFTLYGLPYDARNALSELNPGRSFPAMRMIEVISGDARDPPLGSTLDRALDRDRREMQIRIVHGPDRVGWIGRQFSRDALKVAHLPCHPRGFASQIRGRNPDESRGVELGLESDLRKTALGALPHRLSGYSAGRARRSRPHLHRLWLSEAFVARRRGARIRGAT